MSTSLTISSLRGSVNWSLADGVTLAPSTNSGDFSYSKSYTHGTGASKAQKIYFANPTITASGNVSYDLSGSLVDPYGNAVVFTTVKGIYVEHQTSAATGVTDINGNFVTAGAGAVLAGTSPKLQLRPGFLLVLAGATAGGYTVTNSSQDTITFTNNDAASITLRVVIFGE